MTTTTSSKPTIALLDMMNTPAWRDIEQDHLQEGSPPILLIANNKKDYNELIERKYEVNLVSEKKLNSLYEINDNILYNLVIWNYPSNKIIEDEDLFDDFLYEISEIMHGSGTILISTTKPINKAWNMLTGTNKTITYML